VEEFNELDIIAQARSKVMSRRQPTGENLFLVWGYPTAIILFMEFAVIQVVHEDWCYFLWALIPFIGAPLMIYYLNKDYKRTGCRTLNSNIILQMWIYIGIISCLGGFSLGLANMFQYGYCTLQGLLISMGCFLTGVILRFRPKVVCGMIGALLSFSALFFHGALWPWQLVVASAVAIVALIIPGHMFNHYVKNYGF
jgi:hypothetical protein